MTCFAISRLVLWQTDGYAISTQLGICIFLLQFLPGWHLGLGSRIPLFLLGNPKSVPYKDNNRATGLPDQRNT